MSAFDLDQAMVASAPIDILRSRIYAKFNVQNYKPATRIRRLRKRCEAARGLNLRLMQDVRQLCITLQISIEV